MPEEITFTTAAFGGFEKKQVLDYILKMHEEIDVEKDKQRKKLEDISYAFKELEQRAVKAEKLNETLKMEADAAKNALINEQTVIENIRSAKKDLEEELTQMEQKLAQTERILAQRKKQEDDISGQREYREPQMPELVQPTNYDQSAQIGRVMLDAHSKANRIVEQARHDAEQIVAEGHHSFELRMQQNEAYYNQYKLAKEEEAKKAVEAVKVQANVQINQIYEYMGSLIARVVNTAADTKEKFVGLNDQLKGIRSSNPSIGTVTYREAKKPLPENPSVDYTTKVSDFTLSEKYSDLLKYEPTTIEKPRIEYTDDSPYNSVFPEASGDRYQVKENLVVEYSSQEQAAHPQTEVQEVEYTNYENRQPSYQAAYIPPPEPTITQQPMPHTNEYYNNPAVMEEKNVVPTQNAETEKQESVEDIGKVEFNFNTNRGATAANITSNEGDEITFPSLHPIDYSQNKAE